MTATANRAVPAVSADPAIAPDGDVTRLGMLMEAAHLQQQAAEATLARLDAHTRGLDAVVRDEIRQSFTAECAELDEEVRKTTLALSGLQRHAERRAACWTAVIVTSLGGAAIALVEFTVPSAGVIAELRSERDTLSRQIQQLSNAGGRLELRRCGAEERLRVRVDRRAPTYGEAGDYFIVKGY